MEAWIDVEGPAGSRRETLRPGLTVVGGQGADVDVGVEGGDALHFWSDPPKAVFIGEGAGPLVEGQPFEERPLADGDLVSWRGRTLRFGCRNDRAPLQEIPVDGPVAAPAAGAASPAAPAMPAGAVEAGEQQAWRRLQAGMLVETGLADKAVARKWQDAVVRGEFDADAATRELLAAGLPPATHERLLDRSRVLLRDLLMAPTTRGARGAGRKARQAARGGLAFLVSQLVVLGVYSLMVLVALFVLRVRWDWSVDGLIDRIRGLFG